MNLYRRLKTCLSDFWLDLVLSWHASRADRMREDQEPLYCRPLYQLDRDLGEHVSALCQERLQFAVECDGEEIGTVDVVPAHCVNCGHRGPVVVPQDQVDDEAEEQIVDMLECPECGLYTMCSD